jgi:nicotinate-nucleotide--dimethylbenzimidazole phosphoribosyltransferase
VHGHTRPDPPEPDPAPEAHAALVPTESGPEPPLDVQGVDVTEVAEAAAEVAAEAAAEVVAGQFGPAPVSLAPQAPRAPRPGASGQQAATAAEPQGEPEPVPPPPPVLVPDPVAIASARTLVAAEPRLGRLGETVVWAAGVQRRSPPEPFLAPVALVLAARHGAARYVGRHGPQETGRRVAALRAGIGALGTSEVRLRVVDLGEAGDWFVRAEAGRIDREDALSPAETVRAFALGRLAVDQEVDGGADLLVLGAVDADTGPATAALAAVLTDREPVAVVRRGGEVGAWARTVELVRDARRRGRPLRGDVLGVLGAVGGADLAALTGALVQAGLRCTPVLLDGAAATVCGLLAEAFAPGCSRWWVAGSRAGDPAQDVALARLGFEPLLDLGLGYDGAAGALLALPVLQAALAAARGTASEHAAPR